MRSKEKYKNYTTIAEGPASVCNGVSIDFSKGKYNQCENIGRGNSELFYGEPHLSFEARFPKYSKIGEGSAPDAKEVAEKLQEKLQEKLEQNKKTKPLNVAALARQSGGR